MTTRSGMGRRLLAPGLSCLLAALPLRAGEPAAAASRLPEACIAAAAAYSRQCGGQALLVFEGGRPRHESYANGGAPASAHPVMSITKNLAALAILAAARDGRLALDEPAAKTLPEWLADARKRRITIRQLLTQTSGLAPGYPAIYARAARDKNKLALRLPAVAEPGTRFDYGPANYELLEEILRRKLAASGRDPLGYLTAKILAPLGIRPVDWRRDRSGNPFFSAGAKLTARDLAKLGEFLRTSGRWWIVPILPAPAVRGAFVGSTANPMYGQSFWLNSNAARPDAAPLSIEGTLGDDRSPAQWHRARISNAAPAELVALVGSGGQRVYVLPARRLVVVRLGNGTDFSDEEFLQRLFGRG